jgi:hypothetical protein
MIKRLQTIFLLCMLFSCSQYRHMKKVDSSNSCVQQFKPYFKHVVYTTSVDVIGKHISGLLMIKSSPDSGTRIVFFNQLGLIFFDFGFLPDTGFIVHQIIPKMNNKALIKTLRKDFELILFRNMDTTGYHSLSDSGLIYHAYPQLKGVNFYVTDSTCEHLVKMQRASNKKPIMETRMYGGSGEESPDSISIKHLNFNFSISLKKKLASAAK